MTDRKTYRVSGRVQGVGFRWWARQSARDLGLRGTVRNDSDGTVRLDVAGERDRLEAFEALLARGPAGAHVTAVEVEPAGNDALPDGFRITR